MRRRSLILIGAALALFVGLSGGAAFAYFTASGSGSGTAAAGTASPVTVLDATGTVTNKLHPGSTGDLLVTLNNPNSYSVAITGVSGNGVATGSGGVGACSTTGVTVTPGLSGLNISVAPGNSVSVVISGAATMGTTSDSGCQGATFDVPVSLTVHKG
jgi:hypothetical protein